MFIVQKLQYQKIKFFEMDLPLLGICYGHQLIVNKFGGKVKRANKEYGSSLLTIDNDSDLLNGIGESVRAWMSHGDEAEEIPSGFKIIGHTEGGKSSSNCIRRKIQFMEFNFIPKLFIQNMVLKFSKILF